jgi:hypothetical protein
MKKYITTAIAFLFLITPQITKAADTENTFILSKGWSLVSSDVVFGINKADFLSGGGALFVLNPQDKKYYGGSGNYQAVISSIDGAQKLLPDGDNISALGWWVYAPQEYAYVSVDRNIRADRMSYYQDAYHFYKGWNLIGMTGVMLNKSFMDVKGTCEFVSAYVYSSASLSKLTEIESGWSKLTEIDLQQKFEADKLGGALAIKVANDCRFDFAKPHTIPQVPSFPR